MSEIDISRVQNSKINENFDWEKDRLIDSIKKANFFVDYFKRKWDDKYNEIKWLYDNLNQEIEKSILDNKIETQADLAELKKWIEHKSEIEKINQISYEIEKLADKKTVISPETLKLTKADKLDNDEKQKIFYEIRNRIDLITYIQDKNLIEDFFKFVNWKNISAYYKFVDTNMKYSSDVIHSYIENTTQIDLNLIPTEYFTLNVEWVDNTSFITNQILKWNQSKIESRIRSLFLRLDWYDSEIMKIIDILTKNENTKNIIEKNLPIKLINNKEITNYLKIKWIEIKNNIEKNPKNKFQELANKVIHTNSKDENYNKYIDELDSFINKYWILDKNIFKLILNNIWNIIERFSSINFNKEIANEAVKTNPSVFLNLSTELRKDEDIIKSTIKDKNYFWMAYFINIDSPEVLVKSFNLLKELWVDKKDILRFPNFKNWHDNFAHDWNILWYKMKWDIKSSNTLEEIKNYIKNDENFLKWWNLILNEVSKEKFEKVILELIKDKSKIKKFLEILYWNNNETFSIESLRINYSKLLETCSWDEKLLKTIFNNLIDKQAENIDEAIWILTKNTDLNSEKIKIILKEKTKLSKFIKVSKEDEKEKVNIDNNLLINDFKEFSSKYPSLSKTEVLSVFMADIWLENELWYDEWKLRELISSIILLNYEKIKFKTISKDKDTAYNYVSWKLTKEEYDKVFYENYNKNLEENWLPSDKNNSEVLKNNSVEENSISNIETSKYSYDQNSWNLEINTPNWKQKLNLTPEEKILAKDENYRENLVNFYSFFKDLNLIWVWNFRHDLVNAIWNVNIDLADDSLSKSELLNFWNKLVNFINNTWDVKLNNNNSSINSLNSELLKYTNAWSSLSDNKTYNIKWEDIFTAKLRELWIIWWAYFHVNNFRNLLNNKKES